MKTGRPRKEPTPTQELTKLFYTVDEVAEILGVHSNMVRKLIREDKLKAERVGRLIRIKKETLENL